MELMKKHSTTNTCNLSDGTKKTRAQVEVLTRAAKQLKLQEQIYEHGYNFCERCNRNDCKPIDVSHNISVKEAIESGRTELCWALHNMEIAGRPCHKVKDKLILQFTN
jgi:hypothetical protein